MWRALFYVPGARKKALQAIGPEGFFVGPVGRGQLARGQSQASS